MSLPDLVTEYETDKLSHDTYDLIKHDNFIVQYQ